MKWTTGFTRSLRSLFRRTAAERELDEELRFHLEMQTEANCASGMNAEQARYAALRAFGGVDQTKEECRDAWGVRFIQSLVQDVRFSVRMLRKNAGFTAVAVLSLALGIGSNTAIFSVLDRNLLRPLPYPYGDQLVSFGMLIPSYDSRPFLFTAAYEQLQRGNMPFASMTSWRPGVAGCDLTEEQPLHLACARAESTFLPTFGVAPIFGRNFSSEEDDPSASHVCLISYALWQNRFGGDSSTVGKILSLDGQATRVIGVLPRNFEWPTLARVDLILPEALSLAEHTNPLAGVVRAYARLKPGVSLADARAQLGPALEIWRHDSPPMFSKEMRIGLLSVREDQVGSIQPALLVLFGASLALLLLATGNVANLLLARGVAREHELAVRVALGASRADLLRLQLAESTLLGLFGGIVGAGIAFALLRLFVALAPAGIPRIAQVGLGTPVLVFVLGASLLSGLICGLVPAFRLPVTRALLGSSSLDPRRAWLRAVLVSAQVAMSFVLLIAAGLFLETLRNIDAIPLGIETNHIVTTEITLGHAYSQSSAASELFARLEAGMRNLPGVTGVAVSDSLPPTGRERAHPFSDIRAEDRPAFPKGTGGLVGWRIVTPGFFQILGIPMIAGRGFTATDQNPDTGVIVVSAKLAERFFPSESAIGQHLQLSVPSGPWYTVVGVSGDVKYLNPSGRVERSDLEYYLPRKRLADAGKVPEDADPHAFVLVQSPMKTAAVEQLVRDEITTLDPTLPAEISALSERVNLLRVVPRFNAALIGLFAASGFLLATIGLYGVVSFLVTATTKEIGVRMALGASPQSVLRSVLRRGVRLILAGLAAGAVLAFAVAHLLQGLLYGVSAMNPVIAGLAALLLVLAGLAASYIPARRAARVDPAAALRAE